MATLRSDFLIHWTGKDIQRNYTALNDQQRNQYINRLQRTLIEGLWMTTPQEKICGYKGRSIEYSMPITCFTEIKLSDTHEHTKRYGCLGFGFNRKFVIERCGMPVQYVSGTEDDAVVANLSVLWDFLRQLQTMCNWQFKNGGTLCDEGELDTLIEGVKVNISFIKNMFEPPHEFQYLDEAEWRIVFTDRKFCEGKLRATGKDNPKFKIPFKPCDLKILILPDDETRQQVLLNRDILDWFGKPPDFPIIATVEECSHF